jgi:hypothetical protein
MSIKKFICAAVLATFMCASVGGCYGKFALLNLAQKAVGSLGNKFIVSLVNYFAMPVYGFCLFADFLIFNTIEFWIGSNPVAMGDIYEEADENGNKVYAVKNPDGTLSVTMTAADGKKVDFMLVRNENVVSVVDADGAVMVKQIHDADGTAKQILNADGEVIAHHVVSADGVVVAQQVMGVESPVVAMNAAQ